MKLKNETLNAIVAYLCEQKYKDVVGILQMLQNDLQEVDKEEIEVRDKKEGED